MAHTIELPTYTDHRGALTVLERILPFEIKRTYWIYGTPPLSKPRGGHRHYQCRQLMICLHGSCDVFIKNQFEEKTFHINNPQIGLFLEPEDWHQMSHFHNDPILLVFASHHYSKEDYTHEPMPAQKKS